MEARRESEPVHERTAAERTSEREIVVTRTVNGPARLVFDAWTKAELFERWWVPKSAPIKLMSCEMDVRVGGKYRLVFSYEGSSMEFFGQYLEVTAPSRLVWTSDEGDARTVTTVTLEEKGGKTLVVVHDLYASKEALDAAIASGSTSGMPAQLEQLDELLVELA